MDNINVSLATSTPRSITVGFPLLPSRTTINNPARPQRIGETAESNTLRVLRNVRVNIGFATVLPIFDVTLRATRVFGFNLQYDLTGRTNTDGTGLLRVRNDAAEGGIGVGLNLRADIGLSTVQRRRGLIPRRLFDALNSTTDFNIDLFALVVRLIGRLAGVTIPPEILAGAKSTRADREAIFGLFARSSNTYASRGAVLFTPQYKATVDVSKSIPKIGPVLKKLKKVGVKISFGPQMNFEFPIRVQLVRFSPLSGGNYTVGTRSGQAERLTGGPTGAQPASITQAQVVHSHTIGFQVSVGVFFSLKFIGISVISASLTVPLRFGAPARASGVLGPYFTRLSSNDPPVAQAQLPEVVWG